MSSERTYQKLHHRVGQLLQNRGHEKFDDRHR